MVEVSLKAWKALKMTIVEFIQWLNGVCTVNALAPARFVQWSSWGRWLEGSGGGVVPVLLMPVWCPLEGVRWSMLSGHEPIWGSWPIMKIWRHSSWTIRSVERVKSMCISIDGFCRLRLPEYYFWLQRGRNGVTYLLRRLRYWGLNLLDLLNRQQRTRALGVAISDLDFYWTFSKRFWNHFDKKYWEPWLLTVLVQLWHIFTNSSSHLRLGGSRSLIWGFTNAILGTTNLGWEPDELRVAAWSSKLPADRLKRAHGQKHRGRCNRYVHPLNVPLSRHPLWCLLWTTRNRERIGSWGAGWVLFAIPGWVEC